MLILGIVSVQNPPAILNKVSVGVYAVQVEDHLESGFAIGNGKFLMTCDHVIGSDSKIAISGPKGAKWNGYLAFHDAGLNVAVYRMDHVSPYSFPIKGDAVKPGTRFFAFAPRPEGSALIAGNTSQEKRETESTNIQLSGALSTIHLGSPMINSAGEAIGMIQGSELSGGFVYFGLPRFSLAKFLRAQTVPPAAASIVGNLGQVLERTPVIAEPSADSSPLYMAGRNQYVIVSEYSLDYLRVSLPNGSSAYISKTMVAIVAQNVTLGAYGVVNGSEVNRVVKAFDATELRPTTTTEAWQKETARFVGLVFATAGREISDDLSVQMDIGRTVESVGELQVGDRVYFGKAGAVWAAIYLGNDEYISVSKAGKLVTTKFNSTSTKPFYRALH